MVLDGRLDSSTSGACEERVKPLLLPDTQALTFDLGRLLYISSAGLRLLILAGKVMEKSGGKIRIKDPQPQVKEVIALANIFPKLDVFQTEASADIFLDAVQRRVKTEKIDVDA